MTSNVPASPDQYLIIMRHGDASARAIDFQRPLSERGRQECRSVGAWLSREALSIAEIRHSGLLRAEQTADIIAQALKLPGAQVMPGLAPEDEVLPIAAILNAEAKNLLIVAHLPFVYELVSTLLGEPRLPLSIRYETAGLVILRRPPGGDWVLLNYIDATLAG